jgi:hypothetical protein
VTGRCSSDSRSPLASNSFASAASAKRFQDANVRSASASHLVRAIVARYERQTQIGYRATAGPCRRSLGLTKATENDGGDDAREVGRPTLRPGIGLRLGADRPITAKVLLEGMMTKEAGKGGTSLAAADHTVPTSVPLGPRTSMDLSWLPEEERKVLLTEYTRGILDISRKAQELHVDVGVLQNTLQTLAGTTKEISDSGNAVTVSQTQTTAIGRTEIKMGNTEDARSGKLSKSQTGERDWTPYYILGGIIAVVLVAALLGR